MSNKVYDPVLISGPSFKGYISFQRLAYSSFMRLARGVCICQGKSILQNQRMQQMPGTCSVHLEAFAVDDGGARLAAFLLADPHLLEGGQGGQDGGTDPDSVLAPRGEQWS